IASPVVDHNPTTDHEDLARYASPDMLRHIVLDFRQMKSFLAAPLVMARAEGIWYWDSEGKRYLGRLAGIFVVNVSHANPPPMAATAARWVPSRPRGWLGAKRSLIRA